MRTVISQRKEYKPTPKCYNKFGDETENRRSLGDGGYEVKLRFDSDQLI